MLTHAEDVMNNFLRIWDDYPVEGWFGFDADGVHTFHWASFQNQDGTFGVIATLYIKGRKADYTNLALLVRGPHGKKSFRFKADGRVQINYLPTGTYRLSLVRKKRPAKPRPK